MRVRAAGSMTGRTIARRGGSATLVDILEVFREYPGLLPGLVITVGVAILLSAPVARGLDIHRGLAWLLLIGFGIVASATLTPGREAVDFGLAGNGVCDLTRWWPAPRALFSINYTTLNIAMTVPLGLAVGLLPRSPRKLALLVIALALPPNVEIIQAAVTALGRACQASDVVDNELGLAVGLLIGVIVGRAWPGLAGPRLDDAAAGDGRGG